MKDNNTKIIIEQQHNDGMYNKYRATQYVKKKHKKHIDKAY